MPGASLAHVSLLSCLSKPHLNLAVCSEVVLQSVIKSKWINRAAAVLCSNESCMELHRLVPQVHAVPHHCSSSTPPPGWGTGLGNMQGDGGAGGTEQ